MNLRHLTLLVGCASAVTCAGALVRPAAPPVRPDTEALLVLPGFGYSRAGEQALRALAPAMAADGIDLFVPNYLSRGGLVESRSNLLRFVREHRIDRYRRLHVFAFIAGAWTFNPMAEPRTLANLATVVYDRSPYQERAPRIADETLHFLTWLRYGSPVFDVARTPYPPLGLSTVKIGLVVETMPSGFIRERAALARRYGPVTFECDAFMQRYDDCLYVPLSHDEIYIKFETIWPDLLAVIRHGRFTATANRTPPSGDPLADQRRR
ncbi:MAG: hypothetical protein ABI051_13955 [Vicinamibacterales bacterium]